MFSGCARGTPLVRDLGAIAQTVRGRIVPSPEKPSGKNSQWVKEGAEPHLAEKACTGILFRDFVPEKHAWKKKNLNKMYMRGVQSTPLGGKLWAIAQTVRGRFSPPRAIAQTATFKTYCGINGSR